MAPPPPPQMLSLGPNTNLAGPIKGYTLIMSIAKHERNNIDAAEVEKRNLPVSFIEEKGVAKIAADFMGVSAEGLEKALCTKTTITRGETIVSPLSAEKAQDVCDAFVKGIYGRMFIWIVNKINQVIYKPKVSYIYYMDQIISYIDNS